VEVGGLFAVDKTLLWSDENKEFIYAYAAIKNQVKEQEITCPFTNCIFAFILM